MKSKTEVYLKISFAKIDNSISIKELKEQMKYSIQTDFGDFVDDHKIAKLKVQIIKPPKPDNND